LALTEVCQKDDNLTRKNTTYYEDVMKTFASFKDHPMIIKANKSTKKLRKINRLVGVNLNYFSFRGVRFIMNYYRDQIKEEKNIVGLENMWRWLEVEFPNRYQGYRIVLSPLVGGLYNTTKWKAGDYNETQRFISSPEKGRNSITDDLIRKISLERVVLTVIDHNYVNPITDNHKAEIKRAMRDIRKWNNGIQGYVSSYLTFNEYMTWSVFCAYSYDNYPENDFKIANENVEKFMTDYKVFFKFKDFNQHFLKLYKNKGDQKIPDLYSASIKWMASIK
jgi:hypothetical protein